MSHNGFASTVTRPHRRFAGISLALLLPALGGCPGNLDEMGAEEAVDTQEVAANEAMLLVANADESMMGVTPEQAAMMNETTTATRFQPPGCATVTRSGAVVTHVLNGCTGPRGFVSFTGTVVTTFSAVAGGLGIQTQTSGLKVNRATMDVQSTATLTSTGGGLKLTVNSQGTGTGARGTQFSRSGQYTAVGNGAGCLDLDGAWQLEVGRASRSTTITGMRLCKNACPGPGTVVHTGFRGRTLTITFDGSAEASWTSSRGTDGTVSLNCGG